MDAESLVTGFFHLANSGALSGSDIDPSQSGALEIDRLNVAGNEASWIFRGVSIADKSDWSLAQIFRWTHENWPIQKVCIERYGFGADVVMPAPAGDPYPQMFGPSISRLNVGIPLSATLSLEVLFSARPTPTKEKEIIRRVEDWIAASGMGFYPPPSWAPGDPTLQYDRDAIIANGRLNLTLQRFLCYPGAARGLANAVLSAETQDFHISSLHIS